MNSVKEDVEKKNRMRCCPVCQSRAIGLISKNRSYCADCCVELTDKEGTIKIYALNREGTLMQKIYKGELCDV
ncbi:hypothetical protein SAMN02745215_05026 [Desulfitobacterium chlororespirans DSM 11544]|uniref:Uncharacterized protein n=1 Tax=Desulfitobacterium chlororespirans DSM 11544 TaxID=1121395 RepID=A0A1M7UY78_9FIRM|nr:hypothetical protein SAMN02745215_05026 [Desulfitobacterium chlororespirans DSM 11544]